MLKEIFLDYKKQLEKGDMLQIIDHFYGDNIHQIENNNAPIIGKSVLKQMEIDNLAGVNSVNIALPTWLVDEEKGLAMGEMVIHFDSKKSGKLLLTEAFLQHWENGKIVLQKFYYKSFSPVEN
jgi:hypothetical protein